MVFAYISPIHSKPSPRRPRGKNNSSQSRVTTTNTSRLRRFFHNKTHGKALYDPLVIFDGRSSTGTVSSQTMSERTITDDFNKQTENFIFFEQKQIQNSPHFTLNDWAFGFYNDEVPQQKEVFQAFNAAPRATSHPDRYSRSMIRNGDNSSSKYVMTPSISVVPNTNTWALDNNESMEQTCGSVDAVAVPDAVAFENQNQDPLRTSRLNKLRKPTQGLESLMPTVIYTVRNKDGGKIGNKSAVKSDYEGVEVVDSQVDKSISAQEALFCLTRIFHPSQISAAIGSLLPTTGMENKSAVESEVRGVDSQVDESISAKEPLSSLANISHPSRISAAIGSLLPTKGMENNSAVEWDYEGIEVVDSQVDNIFSAEEPIGCLTTNFHSSRISAAFGSLVPTEGMKNLTILLAPTAKSPILMAGHGILLMEACGNMDDVDELYEAESESINTKQTEMESVLLNEEKTEEGDSRQTEMESELLNEETMEEGVEGKLGSGKMFNRFRRNRSSENAGEERDQTEVSEEAKNERLWEEFRQIEESMGLVEKERSSLTSLFSRLEDVNAEESILVC